MELIDATAQCQARRLLAGIEALAGSTRRLVEDQVLRTHQWIERDGARLEPLDADTRPRAPGGARVMREGIDVTN